MTDFMSKGFLATLASCAPIYANAWIIVSLGALLEAFPLAHKAVTGIQGGIVFAGFSISLICLVFSHGGPSYALRELRRLGDSAVSSELFSGMLFAASLASSLFIVAGLFGMTLVWKAPLAFSAVLAALFVLFEGLAFRRPVSAMPRSAPLTLKRPIANVLGAFCVAGALSASLLVPSSGIRTAFVVIELILCFVLAFAHLCNAHLGVVPGASRRYGCRGAIRIACVAGGSILWGYGMLASGADSCVAVGAALVVASLAACGASDLMFCERFGLLPREKAESCPGSDGGKREGKETADGV